MERRFSQSVAKHVPARICQGHWEPAKSVANVLQQLTHSAVSVAALRQNALGLSLLVPQGLHGLNGSGTARGDDGSSKR